MAASEEIVVPWSPASEHLTTHVRSTLLSSSIATLKARGHYDRYLALLPEEHHEAVLLTLAPTWLDIEHGMAHYGACEALHLSPEEMLAIGNGVGERIQGTFLGSIARTARGMGADPWLALGRVDQLYGRLLRGGGVRVVKVSPKDARIDIRNLPLLQYTYFRTAFIGVFRAAADLFARKSFTREVPGSATGAAVAFTHAWV